MNTVTWSGHQAAAVREALESCLANRMVTEYFDSEEREALQLLLDRANAGHAIAVGRGA